MRQLIEKIKPATGFSSVAYISLNILLPLLVFVLVRINLAIPALVLILLSKWRMFAVRPRFWPANFRANAVDLMVGLSILAFINNTSSQIVQLILVLCYIVWLVFIKPASGALMVPVQALIGMFLALMSLYVVWGDSSLIVLVLSTGLVCYLAARHFFDSFNEPYARLLSYTWGYFGSALAWVLGHWLLYYGFLAQPVLLLLAIGYGLATIYYLDHHDKLSALVRNQIIFIMLTIVTVVIVFSHWGNKIV